MLNIKLKFNPNPIVILYFEKINPKTKNLNQKFDKLIV